MMFFHRNLYIVGLTGSERFLNSLLYFIFVLNNRLFYEIYMLLMQTTRMLTCYPVSVHLPDNIAVNEVVLEFLLCPVAVVN